MRADSQPGGVPRGPAPHLPSTTGTGQCICSCVQPIARGGSACRTPSYYCSCYPFASSVQCHAHWSYTESSFLYSISTSLFLLHPPLQLPVLVPAQQFDLPPAYFIFAGLVFVPLTQPYLHEYGPDWFNSSPRRLCERALRDIPSKPGQEIVILSRVSLTNAASVKVENDFGNVHRSWFLEHLLTRLMVRTNAGFS